MNVRPVKWMAPLALIVSMMIPAMSFAADGVDEPEYDKPSPVESSQVVRRKLLFRSTRLEVAPLAGFTLADPMNRNILAGANASFHLTNAFGIGATFGYGVKSSPTSLRESLESTDSRIPSDTLNRLATTRVGWLASVEGSYVPLFGKMSLMNSLILNYDLHLLFGVGFVNLEGETTTGVENAASDALGGATVAPVVGLGTRFYLSDFVSFNVQVRDYIYSNPVVSNGTNNESDLQNRLMLSVGLSFFLPTDVKVSR